MEAIIAHPGSPNPWLQYRKGDERNHAGKDLNISIPCHLITITTVLLEDPLGYSLSRQVVFTMQAARGTNYIEQKEVI